MKKILLIVVFIIVSCLPVGAQYYYYPYRFALLEVSEQAASVYGVKAGVYPYVCYSERGDMMLGDFVVGIDDLDTRGMDTDAILTYIETKPSVVLRLIERCKQANVQISGTPCLVPISRVCPEVYGATAMMLVSKDYRSKGYPTVMGLSAWHNSYNAYCDYNPGQFIRFDFEFSSGGCPDVDKKKVSSSLIAEMSNKGYVYDTENPDMLMLIEMFADRQSQYIPPTQEINTQYKYENELFSGWGTRQYITSEQKGGYTQVTYLNKMAVTVMDVAKLKAGAKVPPVIYSSVASSTSGYETSAYEYSNNYLSILLKFLNPYGLVTTLYQDQIKLNGSDCKGLGLYYDMNNLNRIVMVEPGSIAEQVGFQTGDIVKSYYAKWNSPRYNRWGIRVGINHNIFALEPSSQFPSFDELKAALDDVSHNSKGKTYFDRHPSRTKMPFPYIYYGEKCAYLDITVIRGGAEVKLTVHKYKTVPGVYTCYYIAKP